MKLFAHQIKALENVKNYNKVAFYHEMGTGKTFTGSEKLNLFNNNTNLVVCQKSKVIDWLEHFKKYYDFTVFDLTNKKQYDDFLECKDNKRIGVINYDVVARRLELRNLSKITLLLDESSMIQNETAKRTKAILKLDCKNVILLSGTPIGGKYERLYSQIKLLGWRIAKRDFWDRYIDYQLVRYGEGSPYIPKVIGYRNIEELKKMLKLYGADFLKSDEVFDLPQQNFNDVYVNTTKAYTEFRENRYYKVCDKVEFIGDTPLKYMLYLRKLCGSTNKYKIDAFRDLLDSTEDRIIVFYNFTDELDALIDNIGDRPYSIVNGATKDLRNYEKYDNSITFIQYQSGAMGLNLQKSNKIIYYSLPLSSELYEQSKKRIHRIGTQKPCFYYNLICESSIEEKIYDTLKLRNDYTQELFKKEFK